MRVIVTRPAAQAEGWIERLQAAGIDAVALPLIDIVAPADPAPVRQAWQRLSGAAMAFFASANAVRHFFAEQPPGAGWPAGVLAAAPGAGTGAALRAAGVPDALRVEPPPEARTFDSESLWEQLRDRPWAGRRVMVVRGEDGRDWLADRLGAAGASLEFVAAYARRVPVLKAHHRDVAAAAAAAPGAHLWLLSSSEAVRNLAALVPTAARGGAALVTHPRIADAARAAGFARVTLCAPGEATLMQAIQEASIQSSE